MHPFIENLLKNNSPLPAGTRISTRYNGIQKVDVSSANRIPNIFSDTCPFWLFGWCDLHAVLLPPGGVDEPCPPKMREIEPPFDGELEADGP